MVWNLNIRVLLLYYKDDLLNEFENFLASQENMAKQMAGVSLKSEEETLYTNNDRSKQ